MHDNRKVSEEKPVTTTADTETFRIRFSVGTKLLISVLLILIITISFLDLSTIILLRNDKRAYTYQIQALEGELVGREFVNKAQSALGTLRTILASSKEKNTLQSILENQPELFAVQVLNTRAGEGAWNSVTQVSKADGLKQAQISLEDLKLPENVKDSNFGGLFETGYAFFNVSKPSSVPLLAIVLADLGAKAKSPAESIPLAIGYTSLQGLARHVKMSAITIAMKNGTVLFDTDAAHQYSGRVEKIPSDQEPFFRTATSTVLASGVQEFENGGELYLGSYAKPGLDLVVLNKTPWRKAMQGTYALTEKFILLGLMALGLAVVYAILFAKTMTAPINRIYEATKEVAKGNFDIKLKIKGRDEIAALTSAFLRMSKEISNLIVERLKKVQLENEIAIASTVQRTLIPPSEFQNQHVQIFSAYQPASQCGGDWWGCFSVGDKLAIMIADATGHGLPSALITAAARSWMSMLHKQAEEDPKFSFSPSNMLSYANRVIFDSASGQIMMTLFAGVYDYKTKKFTYANAGHNHPWFIRKENNIYAVKSLMAEGMRLGEDFKTNSYKETTVDLQSQDTLFLYTDGLLEGTNPSGEMFGKKRIRTHLSTLPAHGPKKIIDGLVSSFQEFSKGKELDDDITIVAVQVR